jgi:hypothetical protein
MATSGATMAQEKAKKSDRPDDKAIVQAKWHRGLIEKLNFLASRWDCTVAEAGERVCGDVILEAYLTELDKARKEAEAKRRK